MFNRVLSCFIIIIGVAAIAKGRFLEEQQILQIGSLRWEQKITNNQQNETARQSLLSVTALNNSISELLEKIFYIKNSSDEICLTAACVNAASIIINEMDKMVNPCDDFYQFVCGKYRKKIIPDNLPSIGLFEDLDTIIREKLRFIMEERVKDDDANYIKNVKNLYQICMNESQIEKMGATEVTKIQEKVGGWPVLKGKGWNVVDFDWKNVIYKYDKDGLSTGYFFVVSSGADDKNTTNRIFHIDQPRLKLSRNYFMKGIEEPRVKAYYDYMVDIAVLFGAEQSLAEEDFKKSLEFEMALSNITVPYEEHRNFTEIYNKMKIADLMSNFSFIPWEEYINNLFPGKVNLTKDIEINVAVPSYLKNLGKLLEKTEKRTIANYIIWRTTEPMLSSLPKVFRNRKIKYSQFKNGVKEINPRWKHCTDKVTETLNLAVSSYYIQNYFKKETKIKVQELESKIRKEFQNLLTKVDWMDEKTRNAALEKAAAIKRYIGFPDELLDEAKIAKYYEGLEINQYGSYLQTHLNISKFYYKYYMGKFNEPINKDDWISHSFGPTANAFYTWKENSISLTSGILQGKLYSDDRPSYLNYGGIGFVIGHEITHGFDDMGSQFDKDGNLTEWWENKTKAKFLEKASCIIKQYGNYTDSQVNLKLNGFNTQGENIADNGGMKLAYKAYQEWIKDNNPEPKLPGFENYSTNQMFWIGAASCWCSAYRDKYLNNLIMTDPHSPSEFRINGPLSNLVEFSQDFNCPEGSPMNPVNKCKLW